MRVLKLSIVISLLYCISNIIYLTLGSGNPEPEASFLFSILITIGYATMVYLTIYCMYLRTMSCMELPGWVKRRLAWFIIIPVLLRLVRLVWKIVYYYQVNRIVSPNSMFYKTVTIGDTIVNFFDMSTILILNTIFIFKFFNLYQDEKDPAKRMKFLNQRVNFSFEYILSLTFMIASIILSSATSINVMPALENLFIIWVNYNLLDFGMDVRAILDTSSSKSPSPPVNSIRPDYSEINSNEIIRRIKLHWILICKYAAD